MRKDDTGAVKCDGLPLLYIVEGSGRPALIVGSALYYSRVFSRNLRNHLRLAFIDHRGFAASPGPRDAAAFALEVLIDDIERVRQALNLWPVVVIGHSGQAFLALEYAKKYPANVSNVVMIGISPDLGPASAEARDAFWESVEINMASLAASRRSIDPSCWLSGATIFWWHRRLAGITSKHRSET